MALAWSQLPRCLDYNVPSYVILESIIIDNRGGMDWKRPYATKKTARHGHVIKYGEWVSALSSISDEFSECSDRSKTSIQKVKIILDNISLKKLTSIILMNLPKNLWMFCEELVAIIFLLSSNSELSSPHNPY